MKSGSEDDEFEDAVDHLLTLPHHARMLSPTINGQNNQTPSTSKVNKFIFF